MADEIGRLIDDRKAQPVRGQDRARLLAAPPGSKSSPWKKNSMTRARWTCWSSE